MPAATSWEERPQPPPFPFPPPCSRGDPGRQLGTHALETQGATESSPGEHWALAQRAPLRARNGGRHDWGLRGTKRWGPKLLEVGTAAGPDFWLAVLPRTSRQALTLTFLFPGCSPKCQACCTFPWPLSTKSQTIFLPVPQASILEAFCFHPLPLTCLYVILSPTHCAPKQGELWSREEVPGPQQVQATFLHNQPGIQHRPHHRLKPGGSPLSPSPHSPQGLTQGPDSQT